MKFSGKVALITGGSCEIARQLAPRLAACGIEPILASRETGFDLAEPASIQELIGSLTRLDYLIDLAHGDYQSLMASADMDQVRSYMDANISGRLLLIREASRLMLKNRFGRMLHLSSTAAALPNAGQGFYSASKLASEAAYRSVGIELGGRGITTVSLRAGYIETGRAMDYLTEELKRRIPTGKILSVDEICECCLFLISDAALNINSTAITFDGGLSATK